MRPKKPTPPQLHFLKAESGRCAAYYPPFVACLREGWIADMRSEHLRLIGGHATWTITEAGREVLRKAAPRQPDAELFTEEKAVK